MIVVPLSMNNTSSSMTACNLEQQTTCQQLRARTGLAKICMVMKLFVHETNLWEETSSLQVDGGLDTLQALQHG